MLTAEWATRPVEVDFSELFRLRMHLLVRVDFFRAIRDCARQLLTCRRWKFGRFAVAVFVIGPPLPAAARIRWSVASQPCTSPIKWTTPRALLGEASALRSRQIASVAFDGTRIVAVADSAVDDPHFGRTIGVVYNVATKTSHPLVAPAGRFSFLHPKVAILGADTVVLVWGELAADSNSMPPSQDPNPQSLWFAEFAQGRWSRPIPAASHASFGWDGVRASALLRTSDGTVSRAHATSGRPRSSRRTQAPD